MMRPGSSSRTVSFVVAGLLVISVLLFLNFWYVSGQRNDIKEELEMLETRYQSLQRNKKALEAKYESVQDKLKKVAGSKDREADKVLTLETDLTAVRKELEEAKTLKTDLMSKVSTLEEDIKLQKEVNAKLNDSLQSNLEEIAAAKKKVVENAERSPKGAAADADSPIDQKIRVREKLRETENELPPSKETDPLVQKAAAVADSRIAGVRYRVSAEGKAANNSSLPNTSAALAVADSVVSNDKQVVEDQEERGSVLKKPKLNAAVESRLNMSDRGATGNSVRRKSADEDNVQPVGADGARVANASDVGSNDINQTDVESPPVLPRPKSVDEQLIQSKGDKIHSHLQRGSEEKSHKRRHKINATAINSAAKKLKQEEGNEENPTTEEGGLMDDKRVKTKMNATKDVVEEEKTVRLGVGAQEIDRAAVQGSDAREAGARRPPLRRPDADATTKAPNDDEGGVNEFAEKPRKKPSAADRQKPKDDPLDGLDMEKGDADADPADVKLKKPGQTLDEEAENEV